MDRKWLHDIDARAAHIKSFPQRPLTAQLFPSPLLPHTAAPDPDVEHHSKLLDPDVHYFGERKPHDHLPWDESLSFINGPPIAIEPRHD